MIEGTNIPVPVPVARAVIGWRDGAAGTGPAYRTLADGSALLLAGGKVRDDNDFVFYNQPVHPGSASSPAAPRRRQGPCGTRAPSVLHRRSEAWKFRAVGQGYIVRLAGRARDFGIDVDDTPTPAAPMPSALSAAAPPSSMRLTWQAPTVSLPSTAGRAARSGATSTGVPVRGRHRAAPAPRWRRHQPM